MKDRRKKKKKPEAFAQLPLAQEHLLSPCEKRLAIQEKLALLQCFYHYVTFNCLLNEVHCLSIVHDYDVLIILK